jgi:biopolymer transport protein ExbD
MRPEKRRQRRRAGIPLTPLIDIVFLLLIYFLLTTNFLVEDGIGINLPGAKTAAPQLQKEITLSVDRSGKVFFEDQEVAIDALFRTLQPAIAPDGNQLVVIRADREVVLNTAVKVMDIAKAAGAARLALATERNF